ncbi:GNAT family N-acetyltransferase [Oxalobacter paraformigenes]|uniref:N-acetyltransferase domain-containing protein n=1 Tax=Oxalobacter paraformigenes TaxID=556268 RepID=C3X254_9BURK|nr:GNAT family N-acetyltransferase [Oxalobacter paraformigenes]EEO27290.1 hypothetical protein OFAG_00443 [Oxalobacter paraformigenes]
MEIRKYQSDDVLEMARLFYNTVHTINAKDYTKEQLDRWATGKVDLKKWDRSFLSHFTCVAVENNVIAGFGDIDEKGYIDKLYVHKDFQRKGIATLLCDQLESTVHENTVIVQASITAKPFFEKRGYKVITEQYVERKGVLLKNYLMEKGL